MRKLPFWCWLFFLLFIVASPVSAQTPQPATDPLLMTPDYTGVKVPLSNYYWDPEGVLGQYNMAYILGNGLLYSSVAFVRLSTWLLNLGYMPSQWLTPIQQIADAIQKNQLIHRIWPILPVIAAAVLFKDFFKHQYQRAVQRAILFGMVSLALILFQGLGTAKYLSSTTEAIDAVSYGVSGWILGASKPDSNTSGDKTFEQRNNDIDKEIWTRLVQDPWEMGEIGVPGSKIGDSSTPDKDINEVQNQISNGDGGITGFILKTLDLPSDWNRSINKDTLWRDVILRFPEGSGARNGLAGILNSDDHPDSKSAFNPYYRALLGFIMVLGASGVSLYNVVMGLFLLGAHVLFILALTAGIVVLPCCLIPWGYSESMLQWWFKTITGSIFIKIALSAYVGATFLVIEIFSPAATAQTKGHSLAYMLLYPIWFVAALWILIRIQKKWRPLQRMTGVNLPGVNRFFPSSKRGEKNSTAGNTTAAQRRNPEQWQDQQSAQPNEPETSTQPVETTSETPEARTNRNQAAAPRTNPERAGMSDASVQDIRDIGNLERRRETPNPPANQTQTATHPTQESNRLSASRQEGTGPANTQVTGSTRNSEIEATTSSQERTTQRRQQIKSSVVSEEDRGTKPIPSDPEIEFRLSTPREPQPQESVGSSAVRENLNLTEEALTGEEEDWGNQAENDSPYKIYDYRSFGQDETNPTSNQPSEWAEKSSTPFPYDHSSSEGIRMKRQSAEKTDQGAAPRVGDADQAQPTRETSPQVDLTTGPYQEGQKEQGNHPGLNRQRRTIQISDVEPAQQVEKQDSIPISTSTAPGSNGSSDAPRIRSRREKEEQREPVPTESPLKKEVNTTKSPAPRVPRRESRRKGNPPANVETAASKIKSDEPQYL
jgi:hypothetical protein